MQDLDCFTPHGFACGVRNDVQELAGLRLLRRLGVARLLAMTPNYFIPCSSFLLIYGNQRMKIGLD